MNKIQNRIPNITSLRFFMAFLVVLFHVSQFFEKRGLPFYNDMPIFNKGAEGVNVFFSLSGFLIIRQLYKEKLKMGLVDLKAFYRRRALRIFPLYYLILGFGFFYYHFVLPYFGYEVENNYNLIEGIVLAVTFFSNIFATYYPGGILEILWSIGIEEQFYLLIAPVFLLLPIKKIKLFLFLFTILYFIIYFNESFDFLSRYKMLFFYFSFSGLCSILLENNFFIQLIQKTYYLTLLLFVLHIITDLIKISNPLFNHFFYLILYGFTISSLSLKPLKILENKILNYLGKISYGIYMYHAIIMQFIGLVFIKLISKLEFSYTLNVILINFIVVFLTITISHLSYKHYESYFLKKKYL
jgi:peptidoglycan/LPS O-acetylase OafA/YrhL